jgi:ABC-type transport system involved in multi-copper enzyme maturation permease subunit
VSLFQKLFTENPMLIEVRRYRRRLFGGGRASGMNIAVLTLGLVCYIGLLMIVGNGNGSIPPIVIVMIQTFVFTLAAPAILNNSIAGEREKGTWDLLLVAPVTKAQIMMGKFAGAMTNLLLGAALFLLPMFICAFSYQRTEILPLVLAEIDSIAFAVFLCSFTILFSARCRRGFTALGVVLGLLFIGMVVYPTVIISALGPGSASLGNVFLLYHPFFVQSSLLDGRAFSNAQSRPVMDALIQIGTFLFLSVVTMIWTERTLTYSDNDTRFLPRRHARS